MKVTLTKIKPMEVLPVGTLVDCGSKRGFVVKSALKPASNGGSIAMHTIRFISKLCRNRRRCDWIELNPAIIEEVNYSFIRTLNTK